VDQRPAVVVEAESAADVAQAVRYARARGMRIAPQGTGHGAEPLEPLDGAMLLRTTRMRKVRIDPAARIARAEAGALWQDVTVPAGQHGLAGLAGSSPDVGVTGYTLGGGVGWLARRYGLAANSVTAAEVVLPDGEFVRADAGHEPDLFWAIRGGGGIGVVTELEMRLYPLAELYAGALFFPIQRAAEVLGAWRQWTDTVPDEVTSLGHLVRVPPLPQLPEALRGQTLVMVEAACLCEAGPGAELIDPLRRLGPEQDTFAMIPAPALGQLNMDPDQPVPVPGDGAFLADFPPAAIDALVAVVGPDTDTPLATVEIRHLGGALARPAPAAGAQPSIDANFMLFAAGLGPTPGLAAAVRAQAHAVRDAMAPWHAGYDYYNWRATPAPASEVLSPASSQRLQEITSAYDPDHAIITAHPVRSRPPT
jgi:hypothetical protein